MQNRYSTNPRLKRYRGNACNKTQAPPAHYFPTPQPKKPAAQCVTTLRVTCWKPCSCRILLPSKINQLSYTIDTHEKVRSVTSHSLSEIFLSGYGVGISEFSNSQSFQALAICPTLYTITVSAWFCYTPLAKVTQKLTHRCTYSKS